MKYIYLILLSLFTMTAAKSQTPNYVIVTGTITNSTGAAVSNWPVTIQTDSISSPIGCYYYHVKYTNPNGYYADTFFCNISAISGVVVSTPDCNNTYITRYLTVPPTKFVQSNFSICTSSPTSCLAAFTTKDTLSNSIIFNSSTSTGSGGVAITERIWNFGDGTPNVGNNQLKVIHTYASPGTYLVRLTIVTANNQCRDSVTKAVTILPNSIGCQAYFGDSVLGKNVYFYSGGSMTNSGDSIVSRKWSFGDPSSSTNILTGNIVNPSHTYANNGTYSVCLKITSSRGCTDSFCKNVVINSVTNNCVANFAINQTPVSTYFSFTNTSTANSGSQITSYFWEFGDSTFSNLANPTHQYNAPGIYYVCLTIGTSSGCQNTICKQISVAVSNTCNAAFSIMNSTPPAAGTPVIFNSSQSSSAPGDSIIQRNWMWGDGTATQNTNAVTINHTYANSGVYTIRLIIISASGCRDTAYSTLTVAGNTTTCKAQFFDSVLGASVQFFSGGSTSGANDPIIERFWSFGDFNNPGNNTLGGNVVNPIHQYVYNGTFTVCLRITSASGCKDSICKTVVVTGVQTNCLAGFNFGTTSAVRTIAFSNTSTAGSGSIVSYLWSFGDSTTSSVANPVHQYPSAGTYVVCLKITTSNGCSNTICKQVVVSNPCPVPAFTTVVNGKVVTLNSSGIAVSAGDSIVQRQWYFGDSSFLSGNVANPSHTYTNAGTYQICLYITTARGCTASVCNMVTITNIPSCIATFKYIRTTPYTLQFNSAGSMASAGDSIISRKWSFGDGSSLTGNVVSPVKTYQATATYTPCLRIQTAAGCVREFCQTIRVGDSTINVDTTKKLEIISINPNPVTTQFAATIWSKYNGVPVQLAIIDVYGVIKWTSSRTMWNGNNVIVVPTSALLAGPYTFRVTSLYGIKTRRFYKL